MQCVGAERSFVTSSSVTIDIRQLLHRLCHSLTHDVSFLIKRNPALLVNGATLRPAFATASPSRLK
jgi:hypothetical protein